MKRVLTFLKGMLWMTVLVTVHLFSLLSAKGQQCEPLLDDIIQYEIGDQLVFNTVRGSGEVVGFSQIRSTVYDKTVRGDTTWYLFSGGFPITLILDSGQIFNNDLQDVIEARIRIVNNAQHPLNYCQDSMVLFFRDYLYDSTEVLSEVNIYSDSLRYKQFGYPSLLYVQLDTGYRIYQETDQEERYAEKYGLVYKHTRDFETGITIELAEYIRNGDTTRFNVSVEFPEKSRVHLYPNPTSGILNIDLSNTDDILQVQIADLAGQTVMDSAFEPQKESCVVDVSALQNGIYLIRITGHAYVYNSRFVVAR